MLSDRSISANGTLGNFAILLSGTLHWVHQRADGHSQIVALISPGEVIERPHRNSQVELGTASDVSVCQILPASFSALLDRSHGFRQALLSDRQRRVNRLLDHARTIAALRTDQRIAQFLVTCCGIMPWHPLPSGGGVLTIELNRKDIASYLNTTVETLSRVLGRFHHDGMICARDPRHFEIPDLSRLAQLAVVQPAAGYYQNNLKNA